MITFLIQQKTFNCWSNVTITKTPQPNINDIDVTLYTYLKTQIESSQIGNLALSNS